VAHETAPEARGALGDNGQGWLSAAAPMLRLSAAAQHGPRDCLPDRNLSALTPLLRLVLLRMRIARLAVTVGLTFAVMAETGATAELQRWTGGERPAFILQDLTGTEVGLAPHRGRVVFVHFFATRCEPCREELPALRRLVKRSAGQPVTVLAVSVGEVDDRLRRFAEKVPLNFPLLLDRDRAVAKAWEVDSLPTTFILGSDLQPRFSVGADFAWDNLNIGRTIDMLSATECKPAFDRASIIMKQGG
jgi:peroxiredoxin